MNDFLHKLMNLCSFAPDEGGSGGEGGDPDADNKPLKTFTQEDLNRIAAQEKRQGVASTLKELGFDKLEDAKAAIEAYNQQKQANMTEIERAQQEKAEEAKKAKKAEFVEQKFAAVAAGCSANNAADVVMLAKSRMTDAKTFEDALEEIKEQYPQMFEKSNDSSNSGGTGGTGNPPRKPMKPGAEGSRAKRLAENRKLANSQKSSYFVK